jgi:hypothetical protein
MNEVTLVLLVEPDQAEASLSKQMIEVAQKPKKIEVRGTMHEALAFLEGIGDDQARFPNYIYLRPEPHDQDGSQFRAEMARIAPAASRQCQVFMD